ncbi:hypothetical protein FKM82_021988 [Ascaphus truei]
MLIPGGFAWAEKSGEPKARTASIGGDSESEGRFLPLRVSGPTRQISERGETVCRLLASTYEKASLLSEGSVSANIPENPT